MFTHRVISTRMTPGKPNDCNVHGCSECIYPSRLVLVLTNPRRRCRRFLPRHSVHYRGVVLSTTRRVSPHITLLETGDSANVHRSGCWGPARLPCGAPSAEEETCTANGIGTPSSRVPMDKSRLDDSVWCCDKVYEECPSRAGVPRTCRLRGASVRGTLWPRSLASTATATATATATSTTKATLLSISNVVEIATAGVALVCFVLWGLWFLLFWVRSWRR